jgi:glycosyltransferase involved in cell wall biosynthesis
VAVVPSAAGRLRVRWVTPLPPDHDGAGGHLRQAYLLDALTAVAEVHLVTAGEVRDPRVGAAVASVTEVDGAPRRMPTSRFRRRLADLRLAAGPEPREVAAHRAVRDALAVVLDRQPPVDVVCSEYLALAPLVERRRDERWVLTLHNLPSGMAAQIAVASRGLRPRLLFERDAAVARRFETRAVDRHDLTVVVSTDDRDALRAAGAQGAVEVVPNGVDLGRFTPTPLADAPRLAFTGALYTGPNVDGIGWFVDEVLPLVRREVPDVVLDVAGARPVPEVVALGRRPGVQVTADPAAIEPVLAAARAAVVPLRVGTGTRLKALEALAAGRPVVGTTVGLGGLGLADGVDCLVADDAPAFAAAVVSVLRDDGVAGALARAGRSTAERFGWDAIGERFAALITGLATPPG